MKFRKFLEESTFKGKVVVVYGGGFQPFHAGHMSSYEQAKHAFPSADFYVAASNDTKNRPIPFKDKQFLAQQAGVKDKFVQVTQPVNPTEILSHYNPKKDILILVRSERDPVNYTKKDGSPAYYQPFKSLKNCVPFNPDGGHGYIFVTKKHTFKINGQEVFSGSQIRSMYSKANDKDKKSIIEVLYPNSTHPNKVKTLLDKYIGNLKEETELDILFEEILEEGVHDKAIFKAVFLAGGPGSGKDYVLDNTLAGHGLTEINSDKALEFLMDKENLDKKMPDNEEAQRDAVRSRAKSMTELRQRLALQGRNGLIINGTGDDYEKIKRIKEKLESIGYETSMITVNTRDEVSQQRNIERGQRGGRTVPENIRKEKWDSVQKSRPKLAELFKDNYVEFDNSEDLRSAHPDVVKTKKDELLSLYKNFQKFVSKPPKNDKAKEWVGGQLGKKDTLPVPKKGQEAAHHPADKDSKATLQARQLGLTYFGFGRWGKGGVVSHHVVHGQLVANETEKRGQQTVQVPQTKTIEKIKKVNEEFENFLNESVTVSVTGDTPEEVAKTLKLLKSDDVEEVQEEEGTIFSNSDSLKLLTLGKTLIEESNKVDLHHSKLMKDGKGKVRTFMIRRNAAKEAHTHNGVVHKIDKGYVVKIKENEDVKSISQLFKIETEGRRITESGSTTSSRTRGEETGSKKITLEEIRARQKEKINEIDGGTEPGMALNGYAKETISRKRKDGKVTVTELTGDETTMSIGDKKEDDLKKVGINLASFKAKKFVG